MAAGSLSALRDERGQEEYEAMLLAPLAEGRTLLHCVHDDEALLVRPLLATGMDVDVRDAAGNTPLHAAAAAGQAAAVAALLACNANPDARNRGGETALMCAVAASNGAMDCAIALMDFGAEATLCDAARRTALDAARALPATRPDREALVQLLASATGHSESEAEPPTRTRPCRSSAGAASLSSRGEGASGAPDTAPAPRPPSRHLAISRNLSLASSTATAATLPLVTPAARGQEIVAQILAAGSLAALHAELGPSELTALLTEPLAKGQTLLHCLKDGQEQLVRPLLAVGMDINAADEDGNAPLHVAASNGHESVLRMLLMCNANTHAVNAEGQDALLCAVRAGQNTMSVVRTLMKTGIGADRRDASGKTALDVARSRAGGRGDDALVAYMVRTAKVQNVQKLGREARRSEWLRQR